MGNVHCPTVSPAPVRLRTLTRKLLAAREAIQTCQDVLTRFPGDHVYTRSLRHWQRQETHLVAEIAARIGA